MEGIKRKRDLNCNRIVRPACSYRTFWYNGTREGIKPYYSWIAVVAERPGMLCLLVRYKGEDDTMRYLEFVGQRVRV